MVKLKRIKAIALELNSQRIDPQYYNPDKNEEAVQLYPLVGHCMYCNCNLSVAYIKHKPQCIIEELVRLVDAESLYRNYYNLIRRYCFICKIVTDFTRCDNCSLYYCISHCVWEQDGDYESGYTSYPLHSKCS